MSDSGSSKTIYLGWISFNTDPWKWVEQTPNSSSDQTKKSAWDSPDENDWFVVDSRTGKRVLGPTLSFFLESEWAKQVDESYFFYNIDKNRPEHSKLILELLERELKKGGKAPQKIHTIEFKGSEIIDYAAICNWMYDVVEEIVRSEGKKGDKELNFIALTSPGPPAGQVGWLLLANAFQWLFEKHHLTLLMGRPAKYRDASQPDAIEKVDFKLRFYTRRMPASTRPDRNRTYDFPVPDELSIYRTKEMRDCLREIWSAGLAGRPFLIQGERGSGKTFLVEKFLSRIDPADPKKLTDDGRCRTIDCGQYQDVEHARQELFGMKSSVYSVQQKADVPGILETAPEGSWLFLDEIHSLDSGVQKLLLNPLDGKPFFRMGESESGKPTHICKARLVCGSNREIAELKEKLQADLFDRLCRTYVRVPPLSEHRDDLPFLWDRVLENRVNSLPGVKSGAQQYRPMDDDTRLFIINNLLPLELHGNIRDLEDLADYLIRFALECDPTTIYIDVETARAALDRLTEEEDLDEPRYSDVEKAYLKFIQVFHQAGDGFLKSERGQKGWLEKRGFDLACRMIETSQGRPPTTGELIQLLGLGADKVRELLKSREEG